MTYTTNVIEQITQDGSIKVVLGAVLDREKLRQAPSGDISRVDQILLMALQEEYSTPALVEFFGRYILAMSAKAKKLSPNRKQKETLLVSDKIGYALLAAATSLTALAKDGHDEPVGGVTPGNLEVPSAQEFIEHAKRIQKELDEADKR